MVQNYRFQLGIVTGGKIDFIEILFVCLFGWEKINWLKTSKIPRSFLLTQPENSDARFSVPWERGLM